MKLWQKSGTFLVATGIIHNVIGLLMGWEVLLRLAAEGFFNTIDTDLDHSIFWFLFSGFMMMLLGQLMQDYIREHQQPVARYIGYYLLLLTLVGCILMPLSGFWIVLPQAFIIIKANRQRNSVRV
jgi:hypothetical protein